jgi:3-methyladenine DNA glycosylase AlkD
MSTPTIRHIVAHLKAQGSREHAAGVQWFFKEEIHSHGWRTADLRRYARQVNKDLRGDLPVLLTTAETLFRRNVLEERTLGVLVLQPSLRVFGSTEFRRFERWLSCVSTWADHDALVMYLLGPLMTADPRRARRAGIWASSRHRWHRRAAAVVLIDGVRKGLFTEEATDMTRRLLADDDDMVRKGLGWLLREWGKVRPHETVPLLMGIRTQTARLVLRTACERLPARDRARILARD